jgi:hypothetical protein
MVAMTASEYISSAEDEKTSRRGSAAMQSEVIRLVGSESFEFASDIF